MAGVSFKPSFDSHIYSLISKML